jgi:hypothetical protein
VNILFVLYLHNHPIQSRGQVKFCLNWQGKTNGVSFFMVLESPSLPAIQSMLPVAEMVQIGQPILIGSDLGGWLYLNYLV